MNKTYLAILLTLSLAVTACGGSDNKSPLETPDETNTGTDEGNDSGNSDDDNGSDIGAIYGPYSTGTTSEPVAVYFDLDTQSVVSLTESEAQTNTVWDIGFKRTSVFLNTHQETPVSVYFTGNNSDFFDESGAPIADKFTNATADSELDDYLAVTTADIPQDDAFASDTQTHIIGDTFYQYDFTTHVVTPASDVYYVVSSDGNYTKFHVTDIVTEGRGIGEITLGVMHQSVLDGQTSFASELSVTIGAAACSAPIYFDFDMQQVVTETDEWDITIPCEDGAGAFAINIADDATVLRTDAQTYAGIDPQAAQYYGFSSETVTDYAFNSNSWYYYDSTTHLLYSQFGVYLIKVADQVFKFQITSYYNDEGTSGHYSFRTDVVTEE